LDIENLRREYVKDGLTRELLADDPFDQFARWFEQASKAEVLEPNAMSLATAGADGRVTVRTVLLKYFGRDGFVFFTNYESTKASQIASNPHVCLLFPWLALERQAIVEGRAEKVSRRETLSYFLKRPRGSQLGAWVSHQSSIIGSRQLLESKFEELKHKFAAGDVPVPSFWGGFRVAPSRFEFWQGRPSRLHDRFQYTPREGGWEIERLAP
jgi:pyridoxamine 5'-phosphate oxidase